MLTLVFCNDHIPCPCFDVIIVVYLVCKAVVYNSGHTVCCAGADNLDVMFNTFYCYIAIMEDIIMQSSSNLNYELLKSWHSIAFSLLLLVYVLVRFQAALPLNVHLFP